MKIRRDEVNILVKIDKISKLFDKKFYEYLSMLINTTITIILVDLLNIYNMLKLIWITTFYYNHRSIWYK